MILVVLNKLGCSGFDKSQNYEVLAEANILVGDALEIVTTKEQIVIKPVRKIRGKDQKFNKTQNRFGGQSPPKRFWVLYAHVI